MSARNELPPGWSIEEERYNDAPRFLLKDARGRLVEWQYDRGLLAAGSWESLGITREELATMRAAVERCAELEAALVIVRRAHKIGRGGTYGLDGSPYALAREIEKSGLLSDTPTEGAE